MAAVRPRLDPEWVESAFARIEELVYNGDASALAGAVAELSAERALASRRAGRGREHDRRKLTRPFRAARRITVHPSHLWTSSSRSVRMLAWRPSSGLAVMSALYFSQARDVKRLREWAGRAPERTDAVVASQAPRVVAKPVPKPPGAQAPGPQLP